MENLVNVRGATDWEGETYSLPDLQGTSRVLRHEVVQYYCRIL